MAGANTLPTIGPSFVSPLRYPGGKGRLGPWLAELIRANRLEGGCYAEPYAGGAGAALYLLLNGHVKRIVINDADPVVYAFWHSAVHESESLIKQIQKRPATMKTRGIAREILESPDAYSTADVGFATFFLNRTSRSGILKGGVIGGKAQTGDYKLDARYNRDDLIARIRAIAAKKNQITVLGMDALDLLKKVCPKLPKKSLVYLDPPYYVKGSQLYRNFYEHADHVFIADAVKGLSLPALVTYDDTPEIRKIYRGMKSTLFSLQYSTHLTRPMVSEVMFYANVKLPMPPALTRGAQLRYTSRSGAAGKRAA